MMVIQKNKDYAYCGHSAAKIIILTMINFNY